jgi:hypothetical protein
VNALIIAAPTETMKLIETLIDSLTRWPRPGRR